MNADIKAQWIAALRSGEYQQGRRGLHDRDTFCCLGVLCDLAIRQGVSRWVLSYNGGFGLELPPDDDDERLETEFLPETVIEWAGLDRSDPYIRNMRLSEYNDSVAHPYTFAEIADLIEQHL